MGEVYRAYDGRLDQERRPQDPRAALTSTTPRFATRLRPRVAARCEPRSSQRRPGLRRGRDGRQACTSRCVTSMARTCARCFDETAHSRRRGRSTSSRRWPSALDAAHAKGLVHRDVKPSNVLIDGRGHCYLADFGLTQSVSDRGHVTDGSLLGTLDYVAPEQIRGDEVDGRADVYALGCMLFECLVGEVPFSASSEVATIYAHLEEKPPSASARRPLLPTADRLRARAVDGEGPDGAVRELRGARRRRAHGTRARR